MPGIVGLITRMPRPHAEAELRSMLASMKHEPFHVTGTWSDPTLGVYVGWCARQGAFDDGMPLRSEEDRLVLVFSGEEYTNETSATDGRPSEAAYLLEAARRDEAFPRGLNGRFHGVLLDRQRGIARLFNDRYGMHRLYYHEDRDAFYFAAEAKAILAVRPALRRFDVRSLAEFITCGCVLENRSLFEGIRLLPCASAWTFRRSGPAGRAAYFSAAEWEAQPALPEDAYFEELRGAFTRCLPRYFRGRQRVGMSLTGGLDTRMIMAWHRATPGALPCYTFGGPLRDNRDIRVARRVAQATAQPHQVIRVGSDVLSRFAHYAERSVYLTDGCVGVNLAPDLFLYEQARHIARVRMTGNYGGEILRGVVAFKPILPLPGLFSKELAALMEESTSTYAAARRTHPVSFAAFRQAPWQHYGVVALEQSQITLRTPYLDNDVVKTVFCAPEPAYRSESPSIRLIRDGNRRLSEIPTDRGVSASATTLRRTAHRLLELEFRTEYAFDYGMPQWLSSVNRAILPRIVERTFLGRHKLYHFRVWYRDVLSGYVKDVLLDRGSLMRPYVNRQIVEDVVRQHTSGSRNYTLELHKLLTLELVQRLFLQSTSRSTPAAVTNS